MYKLFPIAYKHAADLSGTTEPAVGGLCKILADGRIEALSGASAAAFYAVYHGKRLDDGKHVALSGIVASFNAEAGNEPNVGDTVYIVDENTISTSDGAGTRPALGKCIGVASDGTYFVYVKGLLE